MAIPTCLIKWLWRISGLTTEYPAPEIYSLRIRIRGYAVELDHPSPRFFEVCGWVDTRIRSGPQLWTIVAATLCLFFITFLVPMTLCVKVSVQIDILIHRCYRRPSNSYFRCQFRRLVLTLAAFPQVLISWFGVGQVTGLLYPVVTASRAFRAFLFQRPCSATRLYAKVSFPNYSVHEFQLGSPLFNFNYHVFAHLEVLKLTPPLSCCCISAKSTAELTFHR